MPLCDDYVTVENRWRCTIDLFTVQMARWRQLKERNIELIDTTAKSGNRAFAPSWDMVLNHKQQNLSDEAYTAAYVDRMRYSYLHYPEDWNRLLGAQGPVAIACYCSSVPGTFCHRHILKDIIEKICLSRGIPFRYYGEFQ